ncbi:MAG: cyclodeaminase/cyclohydrolase family protein, partial [Bacteroidetes bacterium]|nr:cyclodeaminase/cyclohydrolase family protein [Bacteroidota bacterium]
WEEFSEWAVQGKEAYLKLLYKVDEDTEAFNGIMDAFGLPKGTDDEKAARKAAIQEATKIAVQVPLETMKLAFDSMTVIKKMAEIGNPNSVSDAGVAALAARSAVFGAYLNVKINLGDLSDEVYKSNIIKEADALKIDSALLEKEILAIVESKI